MFQLNSIARLLEIKDPNIKFFKVEDLRNAKNHNLISILDNRLSKNICAYFENCYSLDEHSAVKLVVIDLNANYQLFIRWLFPNAGSIIDRFLIVQLVNRAFDQLRVTTLKELANNIVGFTKL